MTEEAKLEEVEKLKEKLKKAPPQKPEPPPDKVIREGEAPQRLPEGDWKPPVKKPPPEELETPKDVPKKELSQGEKLNLFKKALAADRAQRMQAFRAELGQLLKKYNIVIVPKPEILDDGRVGAALDFVVKD